LRRFTELGQRLDDFEAEYREDYKALLREVAQFGGQISEMRNKRRGQTPSETS
jgi:hypothetical protein